MYLVVAVLLQHITRLLLIHQLQYKLLYRFVLAVLTYCTVSILVLTHIHYNNTCTVEKKLMRRRQFLQV